MPPPSEPLRGENCSKSALRDIFLRGHLRKFPPPPGGGEQDLRDGLGNRIEISRRNASQKVGSPISGGASKISEMGLVTKLRFHDQTHFRKLPDPPPWGEGLHPPHGGGTPGVDFRDGLGNKMETSRPNTSQKVTPPPMWGGRGGRLPRWVW